MRTSDPHRPEAEHLEISPTPGSAEWPGWPRLGAPVSERDWGARRRQTSLARSAGIVAGSFVVSRVLGLVREIVLARQFGTSEAFSAFGSAFIPVFSGFLGDGEVEAAWKLASVVLNISGIVVLFTAALAWVFAPELVRYVVAPEASTAAQQVTVDCMRVLLLSPVFLGFGIAAKGILEGQDLFTLPALAPIAYNTATILGAIVLGPRVGVYGVAIGVVVGAIGFLLLEIPGLVRSGMRYSISFDPRTPGVSEVGRLLAPRLIGQAAFQLNFVAVTNLAWRTGDQSVSALNYAWQLLMLPHGVLALSVSTVILPTLSRLWQVGDTAAFRATLGNALRPLLFLSVPASVILFAFRLPIVQTLFQTGAFSTESTTLVAAPLAFLAAGLASYALVEALTRAFYAMHDTWTPVIAGIAIMALNILIGVTLLDRMCLDQDPRLAPESPRVFGSDSFGRYGADRSADRGHYAGERAETSANCGFSLSAWCSRDGLPRLRVDATDSRVVRFSCTSVPAYSTVASSRTVRAALIALSVAGESFELMTVGYTPRLASGGRTTLANERRYINRHCK